MSVIKFPFLLLSITSYCVYLASTMQFSTQKMDLYRAKVRRMFYHAYDGYLRHAYPLDELKPLTCAGMDTWGGFSLTLVDALDTLVVLGNTSEFQRASRLVLDAIDFDANVNVSVFETNIRVIGGLLSAHMLSGVAGVQIEDGWPCSGPLLRLAERVALKLLPAFNTMTGMPFGTVNLRYGVHRLETPITCTAGVGTFLLEFGTLSRLTGNPQFERIALKAMNELWKRRSAIGLVGNHINVQTGVWTATDAGIGAGVDSYYEYLVKGAILFHKPQLMRQFNAYREAIEQHVQQDDWFMWVSMTKGGVTMPIFQSLEAFWPGVLSLVGDVDAAMRILLTYRQVLRQYGFTPEFYNIPNMEAVNKRSGYPLRPELIESVLYLYRATHDPQLLEIGAELVEALEHSARTPCGYATVHNVKDHTLEDRMESFFLAETTKYLYLLFDDQNFMHNAGQTGRLIDTPGGKCVVDTGGYIFNTEAHPLDPSILYCCGAERQRDLQTINAFEESIDFLQLLGLEDREQPDDFELEAGDLPAEVAALATREPAGDARFLVEQDDSVGYEVEGDKPRPPPTDKPRPSDKPRPQGTDKPCPQATDKQHPQTTDKPQPQATDKPHSQGTDKPCPQSTDKSSPQSADEQRLQSTDNARLPETDKPRPSDAASPGIGVEAASHTEKRTIDFKDLLEIRTDLLAGERVKEGGGKLADAVTKALESLAADWHRLLRATQTLQDVDSLNVCNETEEWDCPQTVCRRVDRRTGGPALNKMLNLMYSKQRKLRPTAKPLCYLHEAPRESDQYSDAAPELLNSDTDTEDELKAATLRRIRADVFPYKRLGQAGFELASCPSRPFLSRFAALGQVVGA